MNRFRLALRVLLKGQAAAAPGRPEHPPVPDVTDQLIALRDDVQAAAAGLDGSGGRALHAVAGQLARILAAQHVVAIEDAGSFDAHLHNAVGNMATADKALDYQVASSVRPGYLSDGALIRRQDVIVYRFDGDDGRGAR